MKKVIVLLVTAACAGGLYAQAPAEKPKAAEKKSAAAPAQPAAKPAAAQPAAQPAPKPAPKPAPAAAKPAEEQEESMVMIDDRAEPEYRRQAAAEAEDQPPAAIGIPASFGQCKGVLNEGGRSMLVFESLDDGTISFVQVSIGKAGAAWSVLGRIPRSNE